jgi:hypothetical protein
MIHGGAQVWNTREKDNYNKIVETKSNPYIPNASTSMASAFGDCKEHEIMVSWSSDGRVVWPVVCQVVDHRTCAIHNSMLNSAVWIVG